MKCQDRFTCFVHGSDCFLETRRGFGRSKMTSAIYHHCYTRRNSYPINAGDKSGSLHSLLADMDGIGLASNPTVADFDIVAACSEIETPIIAQCDIERARSVITHRALTMGSVVAAACVA